LMVHWSLLCSKNLHGYFVYQLPVVSDSRTVSFATHFVIYIKSKKAWEMDDERSYVQFHGWHGRRKLRSHAWNRQPNQSYQTESMNWEPQGTRLVNRSSSQHSLNQLDQGSHRKTLGSRYQALKHRWWELPGNTDPLDTLCRNSHCRCHSNPIGCNIRLQHSHNFELQHGSAQLILQLEFLARQWLTGFSL
jgi:hypothetical protein